MDQASYRALIGSLWSVAEHLRSVELSEVRECVEKYGTAADIALIDKFMAITPELPRRPDRHH